MALCLADSLLHCRAYDGSDARTRYWNWWYCGYNNGFSKDKERPNQRSVGLGAKMRSRAAGTC